MRKALLIFGGLGLLGYGLYRYFMTQAQKLEDFTWKIANVKIIKFNLTELTLTVTFLFTSKAELEAKINRLYLDLYLDGKNVGYISDEKGFIIPANGTSSVPLNISVNPKDVLKNILGFTLGAVKNKDVRLAFKGFANIKSGFISTTLPIEYDMSVKEYLKGA
jgi:LEA14-like dessication related protein